MSYLQTILGEISPIESIKNGGKANKKNGDKKDHKGRINSENISEIHEKDSDNNNQNNDINGGINVAQEAILQDSSPTTSFSTSTCLLNDGALIIADNTLWKGMVLSQVREREKRVYCTVRYCGVLPCILMHNTTLFFMVLLYIVACCAIFYCD